MARTGRRTYLIAAVLAAAVALFLWKAGILDRNAEEARAARDRGPAQASATSRSEAVERSLQLQRQRAEDEVARHVSPAPGVPSRALLEQRLERTREVLERYRESTKYPPYARPLSEQPDQEQPHYVSPTRLPLAASARGTTKGMVILRQSHFYLAGDEGVMLTVECGTSEGPAPCEIVSATATAPGTPTRAAVRFAASANGSMHTAVFAPGGQGFASHHGLIHVALALRIGDERGTHGFDIEYTPRPPAVLTGRVNERLEGGSLILGLEMEIEKPGRYVIAARVDDAAGRSFAYLSFNEELPRGRGEAALVLFGKLILDEQAQAPFQVRDVEGFLLLEDAYPDRALLPTLEGVVHTTRAYAAKDFSDAEWQSEQRDRYLDELGRDVERARRELEDASR